MLYDVKKLQSFHTSYVFWPRKIFNNDLFKLTRQEDIGIVLARRRWHWIGHVLRREITNIPKVAFSRTLEGERKRGCPKSTWRGTAQAELGLQRTERNGGG